MNSFLLTPTRKEYKDVQRDVRWRHNQISRIDSFPLSLRYGAPRSRARMLRYQLRFTDNRHISKVLTYYRQSNWILTDNWQVAPPPRLGPLKNMSTTGRGFLTDLAKLKENIPWMAHRAMLWRPAHDSLSSIVTFYNFIQSEMLE